MKDIKIKYYSYNTHNSYNTYLYSGSYIASFGSLYFSLNNR